MTPALSSPTPSDRSEPAGQWGPASGLGVDEVHQRALDTLKHALSHAAKTALITHRLTEGQVLIVDNRRVLHGRDAIDPASARRLDRRWICAYPAMSPGTRELRA